MVFASVHAQVLAPVDPDEIASSKHAMDDALTALVVNRRIMLPQETPSMVLGADRMLFCPKNAINRPDEAVMLVAVGVNPDELVQPPADMFAAPRQQPMPMAIDTVVPDHAKS